MRGGGQVRRGVTGLRADVSTRAFSPETSRPRQIGLAWCTATSRSHAIRPERRRCDPHTMYAQAAPRAPSFRRALAAGVVVLVTWVAWPADASAATEPDPGLVGQVPTALAPTCESTTIELADAAIACTPPAGSAATNVTYARFSNAELADAHYDDTKGRGLEPD